MENKKIAALILMICLSTSMTGCGGVDTDKAVENAMSTEAEDSESIGGTEESTEPEYTECASYYLLDGVEETGKECCIEIWCDNKMLIFYKLLLLYKV